MQLHLVDKCPHLFRKAFQLCKEHSNEKRSYSWQITTKLANPARSGELLQEASSAVFLFVMTLFCELPVQRPILEEHKRGHTQLGILLSPKLSVRCFWNL